MLKTPKSLWGLILLLTLVSFDVLGNNPFDDEDDYIPEQDSRVARIKFLEGDAQIKRVDNDEWEIATKNLPIVEGDEITTGENSKIEIQFDKYNYLRLAENSYLKIVNLQEEGIAVSLSQGSLNLNILKFDKDKGYFEIDAPKTTVAVQKEGKYRIDAGDDNNKEVRVVVLNFGEARVYSNDSGFTLKNGRSAKLFLDGDYEGEWETFRNSSFGDDFDKWTAERDSLIDRNLRNSYYNQYYDDNIYGADDLNDYGSWVYSRDYGYVWRPHGSTISQYANWSPYRYGHWRWLPYHGWTWVNDEPWGWSTYHYGRWVNINGYWAWSPYSRYRRSRSYWRPALVFITYVGRNICWYPLPYDYGYYDYNRRYRQNWRRNRRNDRNDRNDNLPNRQIIPAENIARANRIRTPPMQRVPKSGVISVPESEFGRQRKGFKTPPLDVAERVLKEKPILVKDSPPLIPSYKDLNGKVSTDILVTNQRRTIVKREVKIGAGDRQVGTPLDEKLRQKTVYGNRTPSRRVDKSDSDENGTSVETTTRRTGVFDRTKPRVTNTETDKTPRPTFPQSTTRRSIPKDDSTTNRNETPRTTPPVRNTERTERKSTPPVYNPPPRRNEPTSPPTRRSEPKRDNPPPKRSEPKRESKPDSTRSNSKTKPKDNKK